MLAIQRDRAGALAAIDADDPRTGAGQDHGDGVIVPDCPAYSALDSESVSVDIDVVDVA
jgi:hypothetical protein